MEQITELLKAMQEKMDANLKEIIEDIRINQAEMKAMQQKMDANLREIIEDMRAW
jgi:hypothetical protein